MFGSGRTCQNAEAFTLSGESAGQQCGGRNRQASLSWVPVGYANVAPRQQAGYGQGRCKRATAGGGVTEYLPVSKVTVEVATVSGCKQLLIQD